MKYNTVEFTEDRYPKLFKALQSLVPGSEVLEVRGFIRDGNSVDDDLNLDEDLTKALEGANPTSIWNLK